MALILAERFSGSAAALAQGFLMSPPNTSIDQPRLVSIKSVCAMTSMSRTMVNALRSDGAFPVAVELGPRRISFVREEIEAWIDARINARPANSNTSSAKVAA